MVTYVINDKTSIKTQIEISFGFLVVVTGGITLAVCYGLLYGNASEAYSVAERTIRSQTYDSLTTLAAETAASLEQPLKLVGDNFTRSGDTLLAPQRSFKEYNFEGACPFPKCPQDYKALKGRSRLPDLAGFVNGSTSHSSVYLYSKKYGQAARNDSLWNLYIHENNPVLSVINGLAYQDQDMDVMYNRGSNSTVMFYLASSVLGADGVNYDVVHRTFPGIVKNISNYDSTQRTWFSKAPVDSFYLYGPYKETFTRQLVVTLSSRKMSTVRSTVHPNARSTPVTTVSGAVMLVKDLAAIVNSVQYAHSGFGVLVKRSTNEVLVWGNRTDVFNEDTQAFKTVVDFDVNLASKLGVNQPSGVIEYTDPQGVDWIVSISPFLAVNEYQVTTSSQSLAVLVFAAKSDAERPLALLQDRITYTTNTVTAETLIIIGATIGAVMLLVCALVAYISHPLSRMIAISRDIVAMSTEEEDKRNYTDILDRSRRNMRTVNDEIGQLAADYYHIVCLLNNRNVDKKSTPKHPENPFHITDDGASSSGPPAQPTSLPQLFSAMSRKRAAMLTVHDQHVTAVEDVDHNQSVKSQQAPVYDGNLDVLSTMSTSTATAPQRSAVVAVEQSAGLFGGPNKKHTQMPRRVSPSAPPATAELVGDIETGEHSVGNESTIELSQIRGSVGGSQYAKLNKGEHSPTPSVTGSEIPTTAVYAAVPTDSKAVSTVASLKSQLLCLCALLLAGAVATMVVTIVSLHSEGANWMDVSSELLLATQLQNLQSVTDVKAVFVQSYFEQLSLDLLVGAAYVTTLVNGSYTRPNFVSQDEYLPSYSIDTLNTYTSPVAKTYNYSSYFIESGLTAYLPYDPRCRKWYQLAADQAASNNREPQAYFQYPRLSSTGAYVLTAVTPIPQQGSLYGVLNTNFLVATLSDSINSLKILQSGYVYLIDSTNTTAIIIHPGATSSCQFVSCAEQGMSNDEYDAFHASILQPLQNKQYESIGASLNNLAAVELSRHNYSAAEELYTRAIQNADELLSHAKNETDKASLRRIHSDREGNLAVAYLEQNQFAKAFAQLERLLISDRNSGYIKGCVVKQGTLGQYYLKQGEIKSAEKVFLSALEFVRKCRVDSESGEFVQTDADATHAAEQIALFNIALLRDVQKLSADEVARAYLAALTTSPVIHTATTTKILLSLRTRAFKKSNGEDAVRQIDVLAAEYRFTLFSSSVTDSKGQNTTSGPKTVAFVIDYSGSMSGTKIRSAVDNVCAIIDKHTCFEDSLLVVKFNGFVTTVLNLQKKKDAEHAESILSQVREANAPTGSTACYDAVDLTLTRLVRDSADAEKWMIVLTDGEDNSSTKVTVDALCNNITRHGKSVSMIVIGVGSDVQTDVLTRIAKSSEKGIYISAASGDKRSIDAAFAQVATLIQGEIVMEDM
eukprot:gene27036-33697_t